MTSRARVVLDKSGSAGFFRRAKAHARALDRGELLKEEVVIAFEDPADFLKVMTKERFRLLASLQKEGSKPITDLASGLGRQKRAVTRDVTALSKYGLLKKKLVVNAGHGRHLIVTPVAKRIELKASI